MQTFHRINVTAPTFKSLFGFSKRIAFHPQELSAQKLNTYRSYLVGALSEGFKQNFLGSDINMEYLVLMLRIYMLINTAIVKRIVQRADQWLCPFKARVSAFRHKSSIQPCLS
ncbi:hypothetical protein KHS38_11055 [Mucilaginibacter sp. Bleaf8]|uniref:hypothetical protein n=1 Tax=Mucilaginibacter sp. Bleaf8 TaxID=2834430 RepID=UPI001BCB46BD|nr:hypothetical protein [Mucilaginibacter sp. Bleaf8]MBS7564942.1 hypothetical protein [Mucilaginibacter sp. Bleaf8]